MKCNCEMCGKETIAFCSKECSNIFQTLEKAHSIPKESKGDSQ